MTTQIRRRTNSAESDLGLHCLPKVPNLDAKSGDHDQIRRTDLSLHHFANVRKMPLDRNILNLGGVSFILFDISLQNKILPCK